MARSKQDCGRRRSRRSCDPAVSITWRAAKCALRTILAAATVYLLERAIDCRLEQVAVVGLVVCAVSDGLAALIRERSAWRTAALVGTARILAPSIGPAAAADLSAGSVREYSMSLGGPPKNLDLPNIRAAAARAVQSNDESQVQDAVCLMAKQLFAAPALLSAAEARVATASPGVTAL